MAKTMESVGSRIAEARRRKGITQQALAKACKVHKVSVARWETGRVVPECIREIAVALNESIEWLLFGTRVDEGVRIVSRHLSTAKELLHELKLSEQHLAATHKEDFQELWEGVLVEIKDAILILDNLNIDLGFSKDVLDRGNRSEIFKLIAPPTVTGKRINKKRPN